MPKMFPKLMPLNEMVRVVLFLGLLTSFSLFSPFPIS